MAMPVPVVPFSELQHRGVATAAKLQDARAIRLSRRDADDLMLTTVEQAESDREVLSVTVRLLIELILHKAAPPEYLDEVVPKAFPWARFLPDDDKRLFARELVEVLEAAGSVDNMAPVRQLIIEWQHTAEIWADPELLAHLRGPFDGDFGPVPEPIVPDDAER